MSSAATEPATSHGDDWPQEDQSQPRRTAPVRARRGGFTLTVEGAPALALRGVTKTYPNGKTALRDVSLTVAPGDFAFLVGPSGAGKSTLIKLLIREELATKGRVILEGRDLARLSRADVPQMRRRIGIVFQDFKLLPDKSVRDNVAFALEVTGTPRQQIAPAVDRVLRVVGLAGQTDQRPSELSGGEQQRTAIARALVHDPHIIIADEPTGNLDPLISWEIIQLLLRINEMGVTVLMATHNAEVVTALRKRVIGLEAGRIVRDEMGAAYHRDDSVQTYVAFSLQRAWQGYWRNGLMSLAATASMTLMLVLLSGLIILLSGLDATLNYVESKVEVVAYLDDSASPGDINALQMSLQALPEIAGVSYVSKEQALKDFQARQPDVADLVGALEENPLPASFEIRLRDPADYVDVATYLREQPIIDGVQDIKKTVNQMVAVINLLRTGGIAILLIVGITVLFIIVNAIRLAVVARAGEIEIMRLVGASDAFIRWPFVFEGALVGLFGALITLGLLWLVQDRLAGALAEFFAVLPVQANAIVGQNVALIVLPTGMAVGILGSYMSVRSYLAR